MADYRIDIHIRRKKEPPFEFAEFKSELADDIESLCYTDIATFIEQAINEDMEGDSDYDDATNITGRV